MSRHEHFDVIVVGGGSAGAVVASRLSEDPSRTVLLLEAGQSYPPGGEPDFLLDPARIGGSPETDWGYTARGGADSPSILAIRGKTLGGSSAVNAAIAIRARAADFGSWQYPGNTDWTWDQVSRTFRSLENTPDGRDEFHGRQGPFPIRQRQYGELTPSLQAFIDAAVALGHKRVDDFNGAEQRGAGGFPVNIADEVRQNTAMAYLTAEVRSRPNLTIQGDVLVDRLLYRGTEVIGVRAADGALFHADEVILSAGAYGSPAILLRSGIGPAADLDALGIPVVADLPVGRNLQDHPFYYNAYALKPGNTAMTPAVGALLWTATDEADAGELDLHISVTHLLDPAASPTGGAIVFSVSVVRPESRGSLQLASRDPAEAPLIDNDFLASPRDLRRMVYGVELARSISRHPAFAPQAEFELSPGPQVRDGEALAKAISGSLASYGHPTATAPLGGPDDPRAVVDGRGRVRGTTGLRVVDASIIPQAPSAATNLTVIMLAEHLCALDYTH